MSHFFSQIGKVFSKVWNFIKPIVAVVAIAIAVYFTAGLALSAFPATAGFAAAMPGFASVGGVAGQGIFSTLATNIGVGGGLQAGAAADLAATAGTAATDVGITGATAFAAPEATATAVGDTAAATVVPDSEIAASVAAPSTASLAGSTYLPAAIDAGTTGGGGLLSSVVHSSLEDKLLLASVGTNLVSGLTAPSPADIQAAKEGFYGSFYGMDANGQSAPAPNLSVGPQTQPQRTADVMPGVNAPGTQTPTSGAVGATQAGGFQGVQKPQLIAPVATAATQAPNTNNAPLVGGTTPLAKPQLIGQAMAQQQPQQSAPTGIAQAPTAKPVTGVTPT